MSNLFLMCSMILVSLFGATYSSTVYYDCNGKGFYCTNSTSFLICVNDPSNPNGRTQTVDDLVYTCPDGTFCNNNAKFECMPFMESNSETNIGTQYSSSYPNTKILNDDAVSRSDFMSMNNTNNWKTNMINLTNTQTPNNIMDTLNSTITNHTYSQINMPLNQREQYIESYAINNFGSSYGEKAADAAEASNILHNSTNMSLQYHPMQYNTVQSNTNASRLGSSVIPQNFDETSFVNSNFNSTVETIPLGTVIRSFNYNENPLNYSENLMRFHGINVSQENIENDRLPNTINPIAAFGGLDNNQVAPSFSAKHVNYYTNYTLPSLPVSNERSITNENIKYTSFVNHSFPQINQTEERQFLQGNIPNEMNVTNHTQDNNLSNESNIISLMPIITNQSYVPVPQSISKLQNTTLLTDIEQVIPVLPGNSVLSEYNNDNSQLIINDTPYIPPIHISTAETVQRNDKNITNENFPLNKGNDGLTLQQQLNQNNSYSVLQLEPNYEFTKTDATLTELEKSNIMSLLPWSDSDSKQIEHNLYFNSTDQGIHHPIFKSTSENVLINDKNQTYSNDLNQTITPTNISMDTSSIVFNNINKTMMNESYQKFLDTVKISSDNIILPPNLTYLPTNTSISKINQQIVQSNVSMETIPGLFDGIQGMNLGEIISIIPLSKDIELHSNQTIIPNNASILNVNQNIPPINKSTMDTMSILFDSSQENNSNKTTQISPNITLTLPNTTFVSNNGWIDTVPILFDNTKEINTNVMKQLLPNYTTSNYVNDNEMQIAGLGRYPNPNIQTSSDPKQDTVDFANKFKEAVAVFTNTLNDVPQGLANNVNTSKTDLLPSSHTNHFSKEPNSHPIIGDSNKIQEIKLNGLPQTVFNGELIKMTSAIENSNMMNPNNAYSGMVNTNNIPENKGTALDNQLENRNNVVPLPNTPLYHSNQHLNRPMNYNVNKDQVYEYRAPTGQIQENIANKIDPKQTETSNLNPGTVECHIYESIPDRTTCHSYYVCRNNQQIRLFCPYNTVYSPVLRSCTADKEHCSQNNEFVCTSPGFYPDPKSCYSYYECQLALNGYKVNKYFCPWYSSYNPQYKQCVEGDKQCQNVNNNYRTQTYPNNAGGINQYRSPQPSPKIIQQNYNDRMQPIKLKPYENTQAPRIQPTYHGQVGPSWVPGRIFWF